MTEQTQIGLCSLGIIPLRLHHLIPENEKWILYGRSDQCQLFLASDYNGLRGLLMMGFIACLECLLKHLRDVARKSLSNLGFIPKKTEDG